MKFFISVLVIGFLFVSSSAADGPASVAELFATPGNLQVIQTSEKTEACILRHIEPTTRSDGSIDRSTERYEETTWVNVPASTATTLRGLILDGKTYDWKASNGGRRPQFYLRLRFHQNDEIINVDFCFMCHVLSLSSVHGGEIGHANFGQNSDLFLQAFLRIFPNDEPLRHVAKEAGLPPGA